MIGSAIPKSITVAFARAGLAATSAALTLAAAVIAPTVVECISSYVGTNSPKVIVFYSVTYSSFS